MRRLVPPSKELLSPRIRKRAHRQLLFAPMAALLALFFFVLLGLITGIFVLALVLAVFLGPIAAYELLGSPVGEAERQKLQATVPIPRERIPWLFFPLGLILAVPLYVLAGLAVTSAGLGTASAWAAILVSVALGFGVAYVLVGFPRLPRDPRQLLPPVPEERKPLLFLPIGIVLAAVLYFVLGVALTAAVGPERAILPALLLGLAAGFLVAYKLVGIPRPGHTIHVPTVPERYAGLFFAIALLVLGPALAILLGAVAAAFLPIPAAVSFPLFVLLGYLCAFALLAAWRGVPRAGKPLRAYIPRLPAEARPLLLFGATLLIGTILTAVIDTFLVHRFHFSALAAYPLGFLLAVKVVHAESLVVQSPERLETVPEKIKPLLLFPLWLFGTVVLYSLIGYVLLDFLAAILLAASLALALTLAALERRLLREWWRTLREGRARRRQLRQSLREPAAPTQDPR